MTVSISLYFILQNVFHFNLDMWKEQMTLLFILRIFHPTTTKKKKTFNCKHPENSNITFLIHHKKKHKMFSGLD